MEIINWIVSGLISLAFLAGGLMKISQPKEKMQDQMKWMEDFSNLQIKGIGGLELIAALGILFGRIAENPMITVVAGLTLCATMAGAALVHIKRKEFKEIGVNALLFVLLVATIVFNSGDFM